VYRSHHAVAKYVEEATIVPTSCRVHMPVSGFHTCLLSVTLGCSDSVWFPTQVRFYLHNEHGSWWDLHVVPKFEILKKHDSLSHANVAVGLEGHVGQRPPRVHVTDDELGDDIEPWLLIFTATS